MADTPRQQQQEQQQQQQQEQQKYTLYARPELGRFVMTLTMDEWLDFIELTLADWLEQVEGAATKPSDIFLWNAGESYAYRRTAYQAMSEILALERSPRLRDTPKDMLHHVMATEAQETRHLVQLRTPPMSQAAADAQAALRAIGQDIPEDLAPKPLQECVAL
jgi:hypothetical protein